MALIIRNISVGELGRFALILLDDVALLYLLKERRRAVRVPYLRLIEEALGRKIMSIQGSRLKRFFSMLVQLFVIAAALFVFADPVWDNGATVRHEPAKAPDVPEIVLVIDRSRSMRASGLHTVNCSNPSQIIEDEKAPKPEGCSWAGSGEKGPSLMGVARGRAAALLAQAPREAHVFLATLDETVESHLIWGDRRTAFERLQNITATDFSDNPERLITWLQQFRTTHPSVPVFVFTDMQRHDIWSGVEIAGVQIEGVGDPVGNVVVEAFRARADVSRPGHAEVLCRLRYHAAPGEDTTDITSTHVQLEISGRALEPDAESVVVAVRSLDVPSTEPVEIKLAVADLPGPLLRARITTNQEDRDLHIFDSLRWAEVPSLRPLPVAVVGPAPRGLFIALVADPFLEVLGPFESDTEVPGRARAVVYSGILPEKLHRPSLIIDPPVNPGHKFGAVEHLGTGVLRPTRNRFWRRLDPGELPVTMASKLTRGTGEKVVLRHGKTMVGLVGEVDGVRVVRLGVSAQDPELIRSVAFPALIARAVDHLQDREDLVGEIRTVGMLQLPERAEDRLLSIVDLDQPSISIVPRSRRFLREQAGAILLHWESGDIEPLVIVPRADIREDRLDGSVQAAGPVSLTTQPQLERSHVWWVLILMLVFVALAERYLFVSRRVL